MRLTYRQVEYLREVAIRASISGASRALNISQSSILAAIDLAEESTGVRLFDRRKGHGITTTPWGRTFLLAAQTFLAAGDNFEKSITQSLSKSISTLRIGCFAPFGSLLIPPVIRRYFERHGKCEIVLSEGDQVELRGWLSDGAVDLVVTYDIGEVFGSGINPISKFPPHALLRSNDPLADAPSVTMAQLSQRDFILLDLPETRNYLLSLFDQAGHRPHIGLRTMSYETVRSAVSNDLGIAILNIKPLDSGTADSDRLRRVPISDRLRQPTLLVADPYGAYKPDFVKHFITVLYSYIKDLGPENIAITLPELKDGLLYPPPKF